MSRKSSQADDQPLLFADADEPAGTGAYGQRIVGPDGQQWGPGSPPESVVEEIGRAAQEG